MAQGLLESVEGFVEDAATKAEGLVDGMINHFVLEEDEVVEGGCYDVTQEENEEEEGEGVVEK